MSTKTLRSFQERAVESGVGGILSDESERSLEPGSR
jgi:hypothetical protein